MLNVYVEGRGNESVGKIQCGYCSDQCWDCANLETAWQARSSLNNRATVRCWREYFIHVCYKSEGYSGPAPSGAAFEGGKWGDCPRPCSWGSPTLQAYEFVKLYSLVNWKCWYMLRLKSFFKFKFRSVVLGCLLYRNRLWNLKLEAVKAAILKIFVQRIIDARCP